MSVPVGTGSTLDSNLVSGRIGLPAVLLLHEGFDLVHGSPFGEYDYLRSSGDLAAISDRIATPRLFPADVALAGIPVLRST